jgi:hypothetical protein
MAALISAKLGIALHQVYISRWELGVRTVPAIVMEACQELARSRSSTTSHG